MFESELKLVITAPVRRRRRRRRQRLRRGLNKLEDSQDRLPWVVGVEMCLKRRPRQCNSSSSSGIRYQYRSDTHTIEAWQEYGVRSGCIVVLGRRSPKLPMRLMFAGDYRRRLWFLSGISNGSELEVQLGMMGRLRQAKKSNRELLDRSHHHHHPRAKERWWCLLLKKLRFCLPHKVT